MNLPVAVDLMLPKRPDTPGKYQHGRPAPADAGTWPEFVVLCPASPTSRPIPVVGPPTERGGRPKATHACAIPRETARRAGLIPLGPPRSPMVFPCCRGDRVYEVGCPEDR